MKRVTENLLQDYIREHLPNEDIAEFVCSIVGKYIGAREPAPRYLITREDRIVLAILPDVQQAINTNSPIDRARIGEETGLSGGPLNQVINAAISLCVMEAARCKKAQQTQVQPQVKPAVQPLPDPQPNPAPTLAGVPAAQPKAIRGKRGAYAKKGPDKRSSQEAKDKRAATMERKRLAASAGAGAIASC